MPQFYAAMNATPARIIIVMLGEVDTGFVIWYRAQKYGVAVEEMYKQALTNYKNLLLDIAKNFQVVCVSTPLPTIMDASDWGEVANLRNQVRATQHERTQLTVLFNKGMQEFCVKQGISYLMLDDDSMDQDGLLRASLRNKDPSDHHYDPTQYAMLINKLLHPVLNQSLV